MALPSSATAAFPGANGRIAFTRWTCGACYEIWTVNPDGSDPTQLTSGGEDTNPAWSADGRRIAFNGRVTPPFVTPSSFGIKVMNADGSGLQTLTSGYYDWEPAWSPDGTKIAFRRCNHVCAIWVMNDDGSAQKNLTNYAGYETSPAWSPDGQTIAFYRNGFIYLMAANGKGDRLLIGGNAGVGNLDPTWAPDGSRLAFDSFEPFGAGHSFELIAVAPDGSGATNLTKTPDTDEYGPSWSPDGTKIAYSRDLGSIAILDLNTGMATDLRVGGDQPDWQTIPNRPPDCSSVEVSSNDLWPPNHKFRAVQLTGARDPDGDALAISITGVTQDEPVGSTTDAQNAAGAAVRLRAERAPKGNGRVYRIAFKASDGTDECSGVVKVAVPHDHGHGAIDSAPPSYDAFGG
jgi:dipeptidyl aminopeptidase/acylaminoacyl peptidase